MLLALALALVGKLVEVCDSECECFRFSVSNFWALILSFGVFDFCRFAVFAFDFHFHFRYRF